MMLGITCGIVKVLIKSNVYGNSEVFLEPHFLDTLIHQPPNNFKLRLNEMIYVNSARHSR